MRPRIQRRRPRDQRRNFKTRCGLGINTKSAILQTAYGVEAGLWPASLERIRDMKIHVPLIALSLLALAVRGATAADTGLAPCRPRPHFLGRPQSLFRSSSAECQSTLKSVTRQPSTILSGNSLAFPDVMGKCAASNLPISLIASTRAWLNFSF